MRREHYLLVSALRLTFLTLPLHLCFDLNDRGGSSLGSENETHSRSWFFFSIANLEKGVTLRLRVVNLNVQAKLFAGGTLPFGAAHHIVRPGRVRRKDVPSERDRMDFGSNGFLLCLLTCLYCQGLLQYFLHLQSRTRLQMWRRNCGRWLKPSNRTLN